jgi:SMC interacting uncharacterized protein involved in chromosome segregation
MIFLILFVLFMAEKDIKFKYVTSYEKKIYKYFKNIYYKYNGYIFKSLVEYYTIITLFYKLYLNYNYD